MIYLDLLINSSSQRRSFFYLSGCALPDCALTYSVPTQHLTLYIPPIDPDSVIWSGLPLSVEDAKNKYDVDDVQLNTPENIFTKLSSHNGGNEGPILFIEDQISADVSSALAQFPKSDSSMLKSAIETSRVTKDAYEIALIRRANTITASAHRAAMRRSKTATNEREVEAAFLERCVALGCREQAYHGIFARGENAATLHYIHNNADIPAPGDGEKEKGSGPLMLIDAAGESDCYAADVTRTFPMRGSFSPEAKAVYTVAQRMQTECLALLKAGVLWEDVQTRAHEVAIEGLLSLGILRGNKKEIFEKRVSVAFFPHGIGHYLGLDTHDVGGNANYEDTDGMLRYLRIRGRVPAGAVVTVEPGVYFCRFIIEPVLRDSQLGGFIDEKVLERFWAVGGVRIEDNILVTEGGWENLTSAPKGVEELEALVNGVGEV